MIWSSGTINGVTNAGLMEVTTGTRANYIDGAGLTNTGTILYTGNDAIVGDEQAST